MELLKTDMFNLIIMMLLHVNSYFLLKHVFAYFIQIIEKLKDHMTT